MRFLLDTNTCVYAMHRRPEVISAIMSRRRPDMAVSVVTEAELMFGVGKSSMPAKARAKLDNFLAAVEILDFTSAEAEVYGGLRATLERAGTPIGPLDLLIAAHAKAL